MSQEVYGYVTNTLNVPYNKAKPLHFDQFLQQDKSLSSTRPGHVVFR